MTNFYYTDVVHKIKTHILCSKADVIFKLYSLRENMAKYCTSGQEIADSMANAHCMRDVSGYRHTIIICNAHYLSVGWVAQSLQRMATGLTVRESNPGGSAIFHTRPGRPWGPPSLRYNGSRVFPGGKAAGVWC
jgi:hypothetical protein